MKAAYSGKAGDDWQFGEGPFEFSGPPDQCLGEIEVTNCCDRKIKIRELSLSPASRLRKGAQTLESSQLWMDARVTAGQTQRVPARLGLPPHTPPGDYDLVAQLGRKRRQLRVTVDPNRVFSMAPSHLKVAAAGGDTVQRTVQLENRGNVPVEIAGGSQVWLREREWVGRTLVYTLRETEESDDAHAFANRLLGSFRESMMPPATVRFSPGKALTLQGAEIAQRTLSITLPRGLKKGCHYLGFIKIADDRLWFEVYCNGSSASGKRR